MKFFLTSLGASIIGTVVFMLAEPLGFFAAFVLSTVATGFGWYYCAKWYEEYLA